MWAEERKGVSLGGVANPYRTPHRDPKGPPPPLLKLDAATMVFGLACALGAVIVSGAKRPVTALLATSGGVLMLATRRRG